MQGNPQSLSTVTFARTVFDETVLRPLLLSSSLHVPASDPSRSSNVQANTAAGNAVWHFGSLRLLNVNLYFDAVATVSAALAELAVDEVVTISSSMMTIARTSRLLESDSHFNDPIEIFTVCFSFYFESIYFSCSLPPTLPGTPTPVRVRVGESITLTKSTLQRCDPAHEFCPVCSASGVSCAALNLTIDTPLLQLQRNSGARFRIAGATTIAAGAVSVGGQMVDTSDLTNNVFDLQSSLSIAAASVDVLSGALLGVCFVRVSAAAFTVETGASVQTLQNFAGDLYAPLPFDACATTPPAAIGQINLWVNASDISVSGLVSYSSIQLCADNFTVDASATIMAVGLGAASATGPGKGMTSSTCASGGGHGAIGGFFSPCFPGAAYDPQPAASAPVALSLARGSVRTVSNLASFSSAASPPIVSLSVGSGGGSGIGGAGGGLIYMHARDTLSLDGLIDASGAPAIQTASGGAGGGAGGSIVLSVATLVHASASALDTISAAVHGGYPAGVRSNGGGRVHATGGDGANTGGSGSGGEPGPISGGGGGGGIILLHWIGAPAPASSILSFDFSVRGGIGAGGVLVGFPPNGADGRAVADPPCAPGYSTIGCSPCAPGSYKNSTGGAACVLCAAGTASTTAGSPVCNMCAAGQYSAFGASACLSCAAGLYSATPGQSACTACPVGNFSGGSASACLDCAPNSIAANDSAAKCEFCAPGQFTASRPQIACATCDTGAFQMSFLPPNLNQDQILPSYQTHVDNRRDTSLINIYLPPVTLTSEPIVDTSARAPLELLAARRRCAHVRVCVRRRLCAADVHFRVRQADQCARRHCVLLADCRWRDFAHGRALFLLLVSAQAGAAAASSGGSDRHGPPADGERRAV